MTRTEVSRYVIVCPKDVRIYAYDRIGILIPLPRMDLDAEFQNSTAISQKKYISLFGGLKNWSCATKIGTVPDSLQQVIQPSNILRLRPIQKKC